MASSTEPPLDETVFSSPALLSQWGGLHTNNILFYFASSPFFDRTSNNATIYNQAHYNSQAMGHLLASRAAFEAHLRSMAGVEFIVAHDPSRNGTLPPSAVTGAWTIRKQNRRKAVGARGEDVVEVLAEYFVVEGKVFQAPTVGAVLGSRLLSTAKALVGLMNKVGECPDFEPARGHFYPSPAAKTGLDLLGSSMHSRGATPVPETVDADGEVVDHDEKEDVAMLMETFVNSARYGKEYMDEHPLVGEPGNFIIQKTKELQVPVGNGDKGVSLPALTLKTDIASVVTKREKGGDKSPISPTGTGVTKKRKRDKTRGQTPKTPRTPRTPAA